MPHELFDATVVRRPSTRARRQSLVAVSVLAHTAVVLAIGVLSVLAPDTLPMPARAIAFVEPARIMPVDIPLPAAPRQEQPVSRRAAPSRGATEMPDVPDSAAAPVVAPHGVSADPRYEAPFSSSGALRSIESGQHVDGAGIGAPVGLEPPPPTVPIRLHSGVQAPGKIHDVPPVYPQIARAAQVEGIVILEVVIAATGRVASVRVLRSVPLLDQAALEAVRQWIYTPARLNGVAIPVLMTLTVNFRLAL